MTITTSTVTIPPPGAGSSGSYLVTGAGGGGGGSSMGYGYLPGYGAMPTAPVTTITTGGTGYYSTPITTTNNIGWTQSNNLNANLKITGKNPIITTDKNEINLDELADMMKTMRERFLILVPNFENHEKYAALKKAYDHYKLIEAMLQGETKDDK